MKELFQTREREYATVHIVCGESPAGSLRVGLDHTNKVIGFPDIFAIGPLWQLEKDMGLKHRYEWLKDCLDIEMDYIEKEYEHRFLKTVEEIEAIPDDIPIVIWTADNAGEQAGIRYILYLLKATTNDVYLINTTKAYQELFNTREVQYFYFHTGEVVSEKLNLIYQKKLSIPLSVEERKQFYHEWTTLSATKNVLRIWENNEIKAVNENYFDQLIITAGQKLHANQREKDFIKSHILIGEVFGHLENNIVVGDAFLAYRLSYLIDNGVFEIRGAPKGLWNYSVKLR